MCSRALWCHRCGYYVCESCIDAARQCPKCLEGNIEDYSVCGAGKEVDSVDDGGGGRKSKFKERSFRTVSTKEREGDYLMMKREGSREEQEEENIYETID